MGRRHDLDYDLRVAANVRRLLRERFLTPGRRARLVLGAVKFELP